MKSELCQMLGIEKPIFQGAMAWIADGALASAVSNAGGLGIIAAGHAPPEVVRGEIRTAKACTDKPFGVNIMLLSPYADDVARLVCDEGVKVVTTGAGNPGKYAEAFKARGISLIPVVPSVALAKRMEKLGADAVIAEGMESGGHVGKLTTMAMLPQIVDAVRIPVVAAGGIGDGRGMAAALMLGARGVQLGTRFLVAKECGVHQNFKNAVLNAKDIDTAITGAATGHPVRVIRNALARRFEELERSAAGPEEITRLFDELGAGALKAAAVDGDVENGSVMCGQIAGLVGKEQTCGEILDEIMNQCSETIRKTASEAMLT